MTDDLVDLLDRQHAFAARQRGLRLVMHLQNYLGVLEAEPRLAQALADLRREAADFLDAFRRQQRQFVDRAMALRNELVSIAPEVDDSDATPPDSADRGPDSFAYRRTLARFDRVAERILTVGPQPPEFDETHVRTDASELIEPLLEKLRLLRYWAEEADGHLELVSQCAEAAPAEDRAGEQQ